MTSDLRLSRAQDDIQAETDIRFNYNNLGQIIAVANTLSASEESSSDESFGLQAQLYSTDGGTTWNQTSLPPIVDGSAHERNADPCVDWTSDGTAWALTIGKALNADQNRIRSFTSTDSGVNWTPDSIVSGDQTGVDKPALWVDHSQASPFRDNLYALWEEFPPNALFFARREGPTGAWQAPQPLSGPEVTGPGAGGDIKTNTAGDVFAFWGSGEEAPPELRTLWAAKSVDGGVTFGTPTPVAKTNSVGLVLVPACSDRGALVNICGGAYRTATQSLVYAVWADLVGGTQAPGSDIASPAKTRVWFARSTNGGAKWGKPILIHDRASLNDQFHPRLAVDETSGVMVVIYYDTVADPGRVKTDVWMQSSVDDGVTWSAPAKVSSAQSHEPPVSGGVSTSSTASTSG
jgi:hypothetical protein